ncbi:glucosamine-6-phosphate deaminase [Spiroplasma tabanidicola]|uniref:Glucosamine-6-phosphate deaminase n=1 Tax=Spiroplasma tabanidicola TaxID=324079 RepID=A0A6I6CHT5_9MOLU|nr:glucosamine-6-phosphate deaminase [Spiroplasma tabanidicola]QGS51613.1 glucosamine-6-phosphate deaminase [Spiroplasma tabanidicola]
MNVIIVKNDTQIGQKTGDLILNKVKANKSAVLGLATGSSPISTYKYIIEKTKAENIDWSNIKTFNLDEYKGLEPTHEHSYRFFMNDNLFNHINIDKNNTYVPSGAIKSNQEAGEYDKEIEKAGGIDLQLLGIGTNGHIGFNEPGTSFDSITSIVNLTDETIEMNSRFFANKSDVPTQAISMGLKSIMNAKEIVLIAMGKNKAEAIYHLVEGEVGTQWPCSILQNHSNVTIVVDEQAASLLKK